MKLAADEAGFAEQMLYDVQFTAERINEAYINQSSLFCYYAEQSRLASKKADNFKLRIDTVEAELDKELRDEAALTKIKITEKAIEQAIARSERYMKAVMAYNDAKASAQMLRDVLEAFKQRRDMLVQVGLTMRDEQKASMRLSSYEEQQKKEKYYTSATN